MNGVDDFRTGGWITNIYVGSDVNNILHGLLTKLLPLVGSFMNKSLQNKTVGDILISTLRTATRNYAAELFLLTKYLHPSDILGRFLYVGHIYKKWPSSIPEEKDSREFDYFFAQIVVGQYLELNTVAPPFSGEQLKRRAERSGTKQDEKNYVLNLSMNFYCKSKKSTIKNSSWSNRIRLVKFYTKDYKTNHLNQKFGGH